MIEAAIFDLDGTLVQTEKLKAISYARAAVELCPHDLEEGEVIEAFKQVVGLPRREVAEALIERFALEAKAAGRMAEFGVDTAWQAYVQVRMQHYADMLADPAVIKQNRWPQNLAVLEVVRRAGCRTGLATMSRCRQANRVLRILDLADAFDFVASRDDVEAGKPDPEIYHLVGHELHTSPMRCMVLEDSPAGVQAALAAGMWCIAVTTPFTRQGVHDLGLLEPRWIVDEPEGVLPVVEQMLAERRKD